MTSFLIGFGIGLWCVAMVLLGRYFDNKKKSNEAKNEDIPR